MGLIIDRKERALFFEKTGKREGELDTLFKSNCTSVEERAETCYYKLGLGIQGYKKFFIRGYVQSAAN